ncbi:MAG TPA: hypothetical protein VH413_06085 [Verrucomicrobiae bacterium]|jgi:hypothetical protein|nr:hypothetical protein [Verrucomicrobiae bacterium]
MSAKTKDVRGEAVADAWLTPGKFAALLGILFFVCFPLVVIGSETFYFRDFGCFGYSLAFYHREVLWHGGIPLWNPYNECGLPFLAQWNTLTLYPLSLFYLIFPLSWSLGMFCLGHLFLGGMGMYFLARRWTGNNFAASLAGALFAFNGLTWQALMWPNNSAALGWMPWVVLAVELAWREGGRKIILAGLAGAMQMLAGAPEIILLTWLAAGAFWLVEIFHSKVPRKKIVWRFVLVILLVAALAAAQLFPFLDLLQHSQRDSNYSDSNWAMPPTGWLNYLVPLFRTFFQKGIFSQYGQFWTASYFAGITTIALAGFAVWRARERRTWVLAALAALSLLLSLGDKGVLYGVLRRVIPAMGFMRFPIKFVTLATFVLPLLAAVGLARFQNSRDAERDRERKRLWYIGGILGAGITAVGLWTWAVPMWPGAPLTVGKNAAVRIIFLCASLACIVSLHRATELRWQRALRVGVIALCWFDVFTHAPNLSPAFDRSVYEPDSVRDFYKWDGELRPGVSRAMSSLAARRWISLHSVADPMADVNGRRLGLFADFNLLDHAAKVDGFYSLDLREYSLVARLLDSTTNDFPKLEDFLCVSRMSNPTNLVDWLPRETAMPFLTAGQSPAALDDEAALRGMLSANFNPRQIVFLEPAASGQIKAWPAKASVTPKSIEAEKVVAEVTADAPTMFVVSQAFYHDWRAYVDGLPVRLWRANVAFQALEVPAGKHEVRLVYEDSAFRWGAIISMAALLAAAASWFGLGKMATRPGAK